MTKPAPVVVPVTTNGNPLPAALNSISKETIAAAVPVSSPNPEEDQLHQAALLAGSYIALQMSNPIVSLSYAREALGLNNLSENSRYLANLYAAESLCMLGKPTEAANHLSPTALGIATENTVANLKASPYGIDNVTNMRFVLFLNLAVVHILKV